MTANERLRQLLIEKQQLKVQLATSESEFYRLGIRGGIMRWMQRALAFLGRGRDTRRSEIFRSRELQFPQTKLPIVVHIVPSVEVGGTGQLISDLMQHTEKEFEHLVVTRYRPSDDAPYPFRVTTGSATGLESYFLRLKASGPVLVHVHYWSLGDYLWYHEFFVHLERWKISAVETVATPVEPYLSPVVREYTYVSDYVRTQYGLGDRNEMTVRPGFEVALFQKSTRKEDGETVGMVYRLEPDKLNELSIDPLIAILKARPNARGLIVGQGKLSDLFAQKVSHAGLDSRVEFTGTVPFSQLPGYYAKMDLFLAPVWSESFGLVVCYALAGGVPVCGYDVGAVPEILGNSKSLVPSGDVAALARVAGEILDSPRTRAAMIKAGRTRAERFGINQMVKSYRSLYTRTLYQPERTGTYSLNPRKSA